MELRHAPILTVAALLRSALGLAFALLAIRAVGAGSFGYFSLVWSFCTAFLFMFTGVNTVLVAGMVASRGAGRDREWSTAGALVTGVAVAALVGTSAALWAAGTGEGELRAALIVCPLLLACQLVTLYCCATLEGCGHVARAATLPLLGSLGATLYLVLSVATGRPIPGLGTLLAVLLAAYAAEALLALVASAARWARRGALAWNAGTVRGLLVGGFTTQAANVVGFLLDPWSKSVLALHLGSAPVAMFDLSMKVGWGLHAVFSAYSRLFLQIPPSAQDRRLASLRRSAELTWVPAALVAAAGVSVLPPALGEWLRVDPGMLAVGMALALATCALMTAASGAYVSLIGFHDHGFIFRNQMILGLANVVAAPLLVPAIGFAGAFAGGLAGTLVNLGLISRRLRHHMPAFDGLASLARPFAGRLAVALALFACAWLAASRPASLATSAIVALAALALLLREPLARATWQLLSRR